MNAVFVDWSLAAAGPNYFQAVANVKPVASDIASFIRDQNIDPMNVHCIGHSLGAHVCGYTGKLLKLKRISGLDPAGPRFGWSDSNERLDKSDAEFVDIIHTDGNLGLQKVKFQRFFIKILVRFNFFFHLEHWPHGFLAEWRSCSN